MGLEIYFKTNPVVTLDHWHRWPKEALIRRRKEILDKAYRRGYRQEAFTDEDRLFSNFGKAKKKGVNKNLIDEHMYRYTGVDISSSSRPGSVIFTIAVGGDGTRYPMEIKRGQWKSPELVREIVSTFETLVPEVVFVENNGVQGMVVDWLRQENKTLPVEGYFTGKQKADPNIGLPSLDVEFQNDMWCIGMDELSKHEPDCECGWCVWFKEMEYYPQYPTTDATMACWFAREAARKYWRTTFRNVLEPVDDMGGFDI